MSLVRVMTRPTMSLGFGAISAQGVPYNDTGDGITPDNFQSFCCADSSGLATPSCSGFVQANQPRFAGYTPCSAAAQEALTFPNLPGPTAPPVPAGAYTPAVLPGDPTTIINSIVTAGAAADVTQNQAAAAAALKALCLAQTVNCQSSLWSSFVSPSADCTGCSFDFTKTGSILLLLAIAAGLFILKKVL